MICGYYYGGRGCNASGPIYIVQSIQSLPIKLLIKDRLCVHPIIAVEVGGSILLGGLHNSLQPAASIN